MVDKAEVVNPLEPDNFAAGGGLWDDKIVTVTGSKYAIDRLTYKDGSPVKDSKTGEQAIRNVWAIEGVAEDDEKSREETYSIGGLIPTADGESFVKPDGTPGVLHKNSEAAKFSDGMKNGGFDLATLWDGSKVVASRLIGAQLRFKAVPRLDKDGNVKKNKKGYDQNSFYPVEYIGRKEGVTAPGTAAPANDETRKLAVDTIAKVLKENGGSLGAAELVRLSSKALSGNPKAGEVAGLVLDATIDVGAPWTRDGATLTLS